MKRALKGIFKKAEFYSFIKIDGEATPVKQQGYTDGKYYYYSNELWYAIDEHTGLAFCIRHTLEECYQTVHSEHFQNLLKESENSETYTKQCSEWYKALVKVGAIMENPISS